MLPNNTQTLTSASALVGIAAGYAAGQHWLGLDLNAWTVVIGGAIVLVPAIVTRAKALKDATGKLANTTVVTDKASADALPANKDVVAVTPAIAAAIKAAQ